MVNPRLAESVAKEGNYSRRAEKQDEDEVGSLADSFNSVLTQVEARDAELLQAKLDLEANVKARTTQLESEVRERKQAEEAVAELSVATEARLAYGSISVSPCA